MSKADSFDPVQEGGEVIEPQLDIYESVWNEADKFRRSGELLGYGKKIKCPVVAIHGDYDPHPVEGVKVPLSKILKDFRFILIDNCGHTPWKEKQARDKFYEILRKEIRQ